MPVQIPRVRESLCAPSVEVPLWLCILVVALVVSVVLVVFAKAF